MTIPTQHEMPPSTTSRPSPPALTLPDRGAGVQKRVVEKLICGRKPASGGPRIWPWGPTWSGWAPHGQTRLQPRGWGGATKCLGTSTHPPWTPGGLAGPRGSPKSMRSLWLRCSSARSSCRRGAEVSRGMLGGQRHEVMGLGHRGRGCWGDAQGRGYLRRDQCLVFFVEQSQVLRTAGLRGQRREPSPYGSLAHGTHSAGSGSPAGPTGPQAAQCPWHAVPSLATGGV